MVNIYGKKCYKFHGKYVILHIDGLMQESHYLNPCLLIANWFRGNKFLVKFESEIYYFHSRKCISNYRLPQWRPFCPEGDELTLFTLSPWDRSWCASRWFSTTAIHTGHMHRHGHQSACNALYIRDKSLELKPNKTSGRGCNASNFHFLCGILQEVFLEWNHAGRVDIKKQRGQSEKKNIPFM